MRQRALTRMLCCPVLSPFSASSRLPGGARADKGTRCSLAAFIRAAGKVQTFAAKSISSNDDQEAAMRYSAGAVEGLSIGLTILRGSTQPISYMCGRFNRQLTDLPLGYR